MVSKCTLHVPVYVHYSRTFVQTEFCSSAKLWRTTALHTNGHIHMLTWVSVYNKKFITRPICYVSFIILSFHMLPHTQSRDFCDCLLSTNSE